MIIKSNPYFAIFFGIYIDDMHKINSTGKILNCYSKGFPADIKVELQDPSKELKVRRAMAEVLQLKPVQGTKESLTKTFAYSFMHDTSVYS